jgi:hypothetical protein
VVRADEERCGLCSKLNLGNVADCIDALVLTDQRACVDPVLDHVPGERRRTQLLVGDAPSLEPCDVRDSLVRRSRDLQNGAHPQDPDGV